MATFKEPHCARLQFILLPQWSTASRGEYENKKWNTFLKKFRCLSKVYQQVLLRAIRAWYAIKFAQVCVPDICSRSSKLISICIYAWDCLQNIGQTISINDWNTGPQDHVTFATWFTASLLCACTPTPSWSTERVICVFTNYQQLTHPFS